MPRRKRALPHLLAESLNLTNIIFEKPDNILEFGVWEGFTYDWLARNMKDQSNLWGFDSFQGLPEETEGVWKPDRHNAGLWAAPRSDVDSYIADLPETTSARCHIVEGWFEDVLTIELQKTIRSCALVNIDVDLYTSSISVLNFIKPLLQVNTILYWDDWKDPRDKYEGKWGEHLAFEQWSSENPEFSFETLKVNKYNQRIMICRGVG